MGSGADALLLDLEDSISPQNKSEARATTRGLFLSRRTWPCRWQDGGCL